MCIWEKAQNLWNEQNYKVPECCFPGSPLGKYSFVGRKHPASGLKSGCPLMEARAPTYFTGKARTIAPFWDVQTSDLHANSEREFRREVAGRAENPVSPFLPRLHAWEAWHTVWTKNNNKSPYSLRESFLVMFQDPSSFLTYSICFATRRPQPQQQKQSRLPCHLSMRSPSSIEACHLAY